MFNIKRERNPSDGRKSNSSAETVGAALTKENIEQLLGVRGAVVNTTVSRNSPPQDTRMIQEQQQQQKQVAPPEPEEEDDYVACGATDEEEEEEDEEEGETLPLSIPKEKSPSPGTVCKSTYTVLHHLDGMTLFDLGSSAVSLILPRQMAFWQNWLSNWAR